MRRLALLSLVALSACASAEPALNPNASTRTAVITSDGTFDSQVRTAATDIDRASATFTAPPERVFGLLSAVYARLGVPVAHNETATRMVGNRQFVVSNGKLGGQALSTYLNCGMADYGGFAANQYRVTMSVMSLVRPAATGSEVQTLVEATAANVRATQRQPDKPCTSTGALERRIAAEVRTALGT